MNRKGMTLIEIIIATALMGIIVMGLLPAFSSLLKVMSNTKEYSQDALTVQEEMEAAIFDASPTVANGTSVLQKRDYTLFGVTRTLYVMHREGTGVQSTPAVVLLSQQVAMVTKKSVLTASNVKINISKLGVGVSDIADMKLTPAPELVASSTPITDEKFYGFLYMWYASKPGIGDPAFPDDYVQLSLPHNTNILKDLLTKVGANRYVMLTMTPVEKTGRQGERVLSSNRVLVLGKDWRAGSKAWIDKNSSQDLDGSDILLPDSLLSMDFDSNKPFDNPVLPGVKVDPSNGPMMVPMRYAGDSMFVPETVKWILDLGLHLSKDIFTKSISVDARKGDIVLYQKIELNPSGDAVYKADGTPNLLNAGVNLTAEDAITLRTLDRGGVVLNKFCNVSAGKDILLRPTGNVIIDESTITSTGGNVKIDTAQNLSIAAPREIRIIKGKINAGENKQIQIISDDEMYLEDSTLTATNGQILLTAVGRNQEIELKNTVLAGNTTIGSLSTMIGGKWTGALTVADGKTLLFENHPTSGKVYNTGTLHLGNTGAIEGTSNLRTPDAYKLTLGAVSGTNGIIRVSSNYGRNIGYAGAAEHVVSDDGYHCLGSGNTNLEYKVDSINYNGSSTGTISELKLVFDGNTDINVTAKTTGYVRGTVQVVVRDKYSNGEILKSITLGISSDTAGDALVNVEGTVMPDAYPVVFLDYDDTILKTEFVEVGKDGTPPTPPEHPGLIFKEWIGSYTNVNGECTVKASYIPTGP